MDSHGERTQSLYSMFLSLLNESNELQSRSSVYLRKSGRVEGERDMMGKEAKGQWNCICNIWLDYYCCNTLMMMMMMESWKNVKKEKYFLLFWF